MRQTIGRYGEKVRYRDSQPIEKKFNLSSNVTEQSDLGVYYTAKAYREVLRTLGIQQSMSRRGCSYSNAPIESSWGHMKEQLGDMKKLTTLNVMRHID